MGESKPGLYETLMTDALNRALADLDSVLVPLKTELRSAEAPDRISLHVARLVARAVSSLDEKDRIKSGLARTTPVSRSRLLA